jgi:hypothetical protein
MKNSSNPRLTFSPLILALLCCSAAMMFSSCSKKASSLIIGKWQVQGQSANVEFKSDGTLISNAGGHTETGKYIFSDDTHMKLEVTPPKRELPPGVTMPDSMTADCVVKINGDDLDMEVTPNMSGQPQAQSRKETVHMKRIK